MALREKKREEAHKVHVKRSNSWRFIRSQPGRDCPAGWLPLDSKEECALAAFVLEGHDDTTLDRTWQDRPTGCFWHSLNGHVNYNDIEGKGEINLLDERICKPDHRPSRKEVQTLEGA